MPAVGNPISHPKPLLWPPKNLNPRHGPPLPQSQQALVDHDAPGGAISTHYSFDATDPSPRTDVPGDRVLYVIYRPRLFTNLSKDAATNQYALEICRILNLARQPSDMADQQPPDTGEPNEALQDMVSDPSMETADNEDDDHAFETSKNPRNLCHRLLSVQRDGRLRAVMEDRCGVLAGLSRHSFTSVPQRRRKPPTKTCVVHVTRL